MFYPTSILKIFSGNTPPPPGLNAQCENWVGRFELLKKGEGA